MTAIVENVRKLLRENADDKTKEVSARFFKEEIVVYGVKANIVHKIAKDAFAGIKDRPKVEILAFCEELWRSGYMEEGSVACDWSRFLKKRYEPGDFAVFERWVNDYVSNWAACDMFCNHTVGDFVMMYPEFIEELKRWASSDNRWVKRAAAVSLIIPARKGLFREDIFEIADILLADPDDMVQKGYGWMLKAAADFDTADVFEYVMSKKEVMPRTSLRYAIEKMPKEMKQRAMAK